MDDSSQASRMNGVMHKPRPSLASTSSLYPPKSAETHQPRRRKVSSSARTLSSDDKKSDGGSSSDILTESNLQRLDLLKELQAEIQNLKHENHELKFFLYVALKQDEKDQEKRLKDEFSWELVNMARDYLDESTGNVKNMRMEMEAMAGMLDEARWIQNHYETRVREQELKIQDLEKQLMDMKSREFALLQLQLPSDRPSRTSRRLAEETSRGGCRSSRQSGRQRSLSTNGQPRVNVSRLKTTPFLPDDYKDTVATLPPIIDARRHTSTKTQLWAHVVNRVT